MASTQTAKLPNLVSRQIFWLYVWYIVVVKLVWQSWEGNTLYFDTNFLITGHTQVSCYLVLPCVLHTSPSLQVCVHQGRWWQVHQYPQQVKYMLSTKFTNPESGIDIYTINYSCCWRDLSSSLTNQKYPLQTFGLIFCTYRVKVYHLLGTDPWRFEKCCTYLW